MQTLYVKSVELTSTALTSAEIDVSQYYNNSRLFVTCSGIQSGKFTIQQKVNNGTTDWQPYLYRKSESEQVPFEFAANGAGTEIITSKVIKIRFVGSGLGSSEVIKIDLSC